MISPQSPPGEPRVDTDHVRRALEVLHAPGDTFEIRALNCRRSARDDRRWWFTAAGYFNDAARAAVAIGNLDKTLRPSGIYVTLNPVDPALLAQAANRIDFKPERTTSDAEIARRRWLFFDLDPERPAGICASDSERAAAMAFVADLEDALRPRGLADPLIALSGNGFYLLYRIDMPNDDDSTALIQRIYAAATTATAESAAAHRTKIDATTFNAARIVRVPGTVNRKGDHLPERPHRIAELYSPDDEETEFPT